MLKKINLFAFVTMFTFLLIPQNDAVAQGRNVEEVEFTVLGNCGMCKDRIERAAYSVRGVRSANWNQEQQKLIITFRTDRTDQETIERTIAKAGHDTENFITDEETHANLHHCCIYPRDPEMLENNRLYNEE
ncbi:MAG: metal transporter [Bacteroidetes bacterium]|nr:MAG: metal transporter [Bacteroidota bacterium]